ncbi:MAG: hypothetical protein ACJ735_03845 [Actinomycetes bacterium]
MLLPRMGRTAFANPGDGGQTPISMAMHIHASFSESTGSMASQLECARRAGVNVVWFTEHDWRMSAHDYRTQVHFNSLTGEKEFGKQWAWKPQKFGALADYGGGLVTSPVSPNDPSTVTGALHVYAQSQSVSQASYLYFAYADSSRHNQRTNLNGTTITLDVLVGAAAAQGYPELRIQLSNHPASGGRTAGQYVLSYRFGVDGVPYTQGLLGVIPVSVPPGDWTTVALTPTSDISSLWPDLIAEDNSLVNLWLGVTSSAGVMGEGWFDWLRFDRSQVSGNQPLDTQASILARLGPMYPELLAYAAQEVSFHPEHLNWYGGEQYLHPYNSKTDASVVQKDSPQFTQFLAQEMMQLGGTVSINHPFGASDEQIGNIGDTARARRNLATKYLTWDAFGVDLLEVAYQQRGGAGMADHVGLWDTLSRNGLWLTGTGVSDNHNGLSHNGWLDDTNRFTTSAWASASDPDTLLATLRTGRAFCAEIGAGVSAVDLTVDGIAMGSVSVRPDLTTRTAQLTVGGLPADGSVQLVQGIVDYAGVNDPEPLTNVVKVLGAADFDSGLASVDIDSSVSSYVRLNVLNSSGRCVALSNPLWILAEPPATPVPTQRQAPDTIWS